MIPSSRFLRLSSVSCRSYATASNKLSSLAHSKAESLAKWRGTSYTGGNVTNYIGGEFIESKASKWIPVHDPSTQTLLSNVPETTEAEFEQAIEVAADAFKTWSRTSVLTRQKFALEFVLTLLVLLAVANLQTDFNAKFEKIQTLWQHLSYLNKEKLLAVCSIFTLEGHFVEIHDRCSRRRFTWFASSRNCLWDSG